MERRKHRLQWIVASCQGWIGLSLQIYEYLWLLNISDISHGVAGECKHSRAGGKFGPDFGFPGIL